jgi:hypothetical protein
MQSDTKRKKYVKPTVSRVETNDSISDLAMACCST